MDRTSEGAGASAQAAAPEPYARLPEEHRLLGPDVPILPELEVLGERREVKFAGISIAGRRRRPTGEGAPLPRQLSLGGRIWLAAAIGTALVWLSLFAAPATTGWWTERDLAVLRWLEDTRTDGGIAVAKVFHWFGSEWVVRSLRLATLLALVFVRRWRHFFAVLLAVISVELVVAQLQLAIGRVRPTVEIVGSWSGPSHPSQPVAALAVTSMAMALALVPKGRYRAVAMWIGALFVTLLGLGRMYLGVDHPTDVLVSMLFAPAVAFVLFRWFAPNSVFPVTWRRGVTAHLDVAGERSDAIRRAVREQVGVEVLEITPFHLEGSGGSTPLRLKVAGDAENGDAFLFAKLYSSTHLNSDRWYKLGRSILYGSLEDEVRFTSVRRLVEYEDYIQRVMIDIGVPTAVPIAVVEITPEREYVLVSEFLDDAKEITDVVVSERLIDEALRTIRVMWDAGMAHRDVKPSNVMVHRGKVVLIDLAFGMIRPSPWRQAVDLANMMLILALKTDVRTVYERALLQFAPADIAEAFAATHSVTIPRQTRTLLAAYKRQHGVDLVSEFNEISPPREPIGVQRWSPNRIGRTALIAAGVALIAFRLLFEVQGRGIL